MANLGFIKKVKKGQDLQVISLEVFLIWRRLVSKGKINETATKTPRSTSGDLLWQLETGYRYAYRYPVSIQGLDTSGIGFCFK
jgi:hypothetical protein